MLKISDFNHNVYQTSSSKLIINFRNKKKMKSTIQNLAKINSGLLIQNKNLIIFCNIPVPQELCWLACSIQRVGQKYVWELTFARGCWGLEIPPSNQDNYSNWRNHLDSNMAIKALYPLDLWSFLYALIKYLLVEIWIIDHSNIKLACKQGSIDIRRNWK